MTNITEVEQYDAAISVPDTGEKVIAVSNTSPPPAGEGPIRPALQSLSNRLKFLKAWRDRLAIGTRSLKALVIDGTGDQAVTPTSGTLVVSTASAGAAVQAGTLYRDGLPIAKAVCKADASAFLGTNPYNCATLQRNGVVGDYRITTKTCPPELAGLGDGTTVYVPVQVTVISGFSNSATISAHVTKQTSGAGAPVLRIDVLILDVTASPVALVDKDFSLVVG